MHSQATVFGTFDMPDSRTATEQIARLSERVESLTGKVEELDGNVEKLVAAWNTANNLVLFFKWLAGGVTAIGVLYAALKHYFSQLK